MSDDSYRTAMTDLMVVSVYDVTDEEAWPDDSPGGDDDAAVAGWDSPAEDAPAQQLRHGSVDDFVREVLCPAYRRQVGPRGSRRWSAEWWRSTEATARLEAMWRAWEHLRLDGATGMSTWWRDHADPQMERLFDPQGPFAGSTDENRAGEPLPYAPPPPGLFRDAREESA